MMATTAYEKDGWRTLRRSESVLCRTIVISEFLFIVDYSDLTLDMKKMGPGNL